MPFTGQRRSDVVRFGRQHAKGGWLTFTPTKNQNRNPVTLSIPILPELQPVLGAVPSSNMTFLVTEFGKPFTSNGFGNRVEDVNREARCRIRPMRAAAIC